MTVYIVLIVTILIGNFFVCQYGESQRNKKYYCVFIALQLLCVIGLRDIGVGLYDTELSYVPAFYSIINMTMSEVLVRFAKDPFFFFITKIFTYVCKDVHCWLTFLAIPFVVASSRLIYRYSAQPWLSFLLLLALNFYTVNFTLLRNGIAFAFLIFSYDFIVKKKLSYFILTVLIASLFHVTALVFLIAYPLSNLKIDRRQPVLLIVSLVACLFYRHVFFDRIFSILMYFSDNNRFLAYSKRGLYFNLSSFYVALCILCFCLIFYKKLIKKDINSICMYNFSFINASMLCFTLLIGEIYRVAMFFGVYSIILIPNSLSTIENKNLRFFLTIGVSLVFILFFLFVTLNNAGALPYYFFWDL